MKIEVSICPAEIRLLPEADLSSRVCVVFDVLRATSTMVTGLYHGVQQIFPVRDIEEAHCLRQKHPEALLGGERNGEKIENFHLGNSPLEYLSIPGKSVITTTTNGTVALRACDGAREVLVASLLNIRATAQYLGTSGAEKIHLVCAGTGSRFALEDAIGGGALLSGLLTLVPDARLDDAAAMLQQLWKCSHADPYHMLASSKNGRRLIKVGREAEVAWCAQLDTCPVVAHMENGRLIQLRD